jgi:predicted ATPase
VLGVLTEIAESRPAVILLEDLHWADGSTRNLLSFLAYRTNNFANLSPVVISATR